MKTDKPLIHCITNPISINDCANIVLAAGAKPIMAEHPAEVCEITASAKALAVNLGNITDARMESMLLSGHTAHQNHIPAILDLVGVGCSKLRLDYAKRFIAECSPGVIKGNLSEIKALSGMKSCAKGIDVGEQDEINAVGYEKAGGLLKRLALETGAVVMATGAEDIVTDGVLACRIENGCEMLSQITGTGCMLNVLTAAYLSKGSLLGGTVLAATVMGIGGELANQAAGPGSFHTALLDSIFSLSDTEIADGIRITFF